MQAPAQEPATAPDHDTTYYESFFGKTITGRYYFSQKYTAFEIKRNNETTPRLRYTPNTTLNMGVGATYGSFTLNLAFGFGFLNRGEEQKGETKYWENQGHKYGRKWGYDLHANFYKGYFLHPKGTGSNDQDLYYIRPDIKFNLFGLAPFRVLNDKKFSYRAAMVQNEWQKRSAGSFLLGGEMYYGIVKADSALVPESVAMSYKQQGIHKIQFFEIGPGAGYAYTLVLAQHFFITGGLNANLNVGWVRETSDVGSDDCFSFTPNFLYRAAVGYNSPTWNVNVSWVSNRISVRGPSAADGYIGRAGNIRATLARQFPVGPKAKKILKRIDKMGAKK
ncbi:MAG TPA: DUF4421 domain-containing protein [Chitinophagaceae bacterium]